MRIAIDAHAIGKRQTGNEVYVRNLLAHFVNLAPEAEFLAYVSSEEVLPHIPPPVDVRYVSSNPFVRLGYQLGSLLSRDNPDLVHVQYTAPLRCPVPVVVTVHDVSFLERPEFFSPFRQQQLALTVKQTVSRAARILTCSEFSRQAIARAYQVDPDFVRVAHNAASPLFRPLEKRTARNVIRKRYGIRAPFILCVGNLQRRKNQLGLIRAYQSLVNAHPDTTQHLVFVGKDTSQASEIRAAARHLSLQDRVHFTGFVPDDMLPYFYNAADLFAFPSFYEGFGIPVLEAMACGCPIASSNQTALPEVAGNTALYFDPQSRDSMAQVLRDMLQNLDLCRQLGRAALERSRQFAWHFTAQKVLDVYSEVAQQRVPVPVDRGTRMMAPGS